MGKTKPRMLLTAAVGLLLAAPSGCAGDRGPSTPPTPTPYGTDGGVNPSAPADPAGQTSPTAADGGSNDCPAGQTACGSRCVATSTDPNNCGLCARQSLTGVCVGGTCQPECTYDDLNACGGDKQKWCANGYCQPCANGRFNCDNTRGCECETGCDNDRCTDPTCSNKDPAGCDNDAAKWCYHKDGQSSPGQCKSCTNDTHTHRFNCDGVDGCECVSKEKYVVGTGYTGTWSHECQGGQCIEIN